MTETEKNEEELHCNDCGRATVHRAVNNYRNKEFSEDIKDGWGNVMTTVDGFHDWELFECQGCKAVFLRLRQYFSEWHNGFPDEDPCEYSFFPKRNTDARVKPHWFETFSNLEGLQGHFILISYKQIYALIEAEQYLAALLTSRALLETIAIENGDGDLRTFEQKLQSLKDEGFIREKQIQHLNQAIYDAGSAAMHRSYNPSSKTVTYVLDSIEQLLHTIYIEPLVEAELLAEKPAKKQKVKNV